MSKIIDKRKEYTDEITSWDWVAIKADAYKGLYFPEDDGDDFLIGSCPLHSFRMTPSGKIYAPWTTNQRRRDVVLDALYQSVLESVAAKHGMHVEWNDDWLHAVLSVDFDEFNAEIMWFLDNETEAKFKELIK